MFECAENFSRSISKVTAIAFLLFMATIGFGTGSAGISQIEKGDVIGDDSSETKAIVVENADPKKQVKKELKDRFGILREGIKVTADDTIAYIVTVQTVAVERDSQAKDFIEVRNMAYETAEVQAKGQLALLLSAKVESSVKSSSQVFPEIVPAEFKDPKMVSLVEKIENLANKELDSAIRAHDPNWNGSYEDAVRMKNKLIAQKRTFSTRAKISAYYEVLGVTPVITAEGFDFKGIYKVSAAYVWSPMTNALAKSITGKGPKLRKKEKSIASLDEQIEANLADDKNFLALTYGPRMWWDENGEATLVVFGSLDYFGDENILNERIDIDNSAAIGRFAGSVVDRFADQEKGVQKFVKRDGNVTTINTSKLNSYIQERSKLVKISGAHTIHEWEGFHPLTKKPMKVRVMAWSLGAREGIAKAKKLMKRDIRKVQKKKRSKVKRVGSFRGGKGAAGSF